MIECQLQVGRASQTGSSGAHSSGGIAVGSQPAEGRLVLGVPLGAVCGELDRAVGETLKQDLHSVSCSSERSRRC